MDSKFRDALLEEDVVDLLGQLFGEAQLLVELLVVLADGTYALELLGAGGGAQELHLAPGQATLVMSVTQGSWPAFAGTRQQLSGSQRLAEATFYVREGGLRLRFLRTGD